MKKEIKALLLKDLEQNKADLADHEAIKTALKKWDGKKITKHMLKDFEAGASIRFIAGMSHIKLERGEKYGEHLISYDGFVHYDQFERFDSWAFGGAKGRISQIEHLLKPENFEGFVKMFVKLQKAMQQLSLVVKELEASKYESYYNPVYYELLHMCGLNSNLVSDIKYNKLTTK